MPIRVLHDGWPLVHAPLSAAALHLRTLLALAPEETEPLVALPVSSSAETGEERIKVIYQETRDAGSWQQRTLPRLAAEHGGNCIHTTQLAASLLGRVPTVVSPAEAANPERGSRLAEAQGFGGLARATILWPQDMEKPKLPGQIVTIPPVTHPDFKHGHAELPTELGLPEGFILVHGNLSQEQILALLESWTWAAASMGELYPLLILGLGEAMNAFASSRLPEFHVEESVKLVPKIQEQYLPGIYQASSAVVPMGVPGAWGNSLRHALACGKAVVAQENASIDAIVGKAAYLVAPDDLRSFGAAIITVVVDEQAREKLEDAAWQRAQQWKPAEFQSELMNVYRELA
ncbi:MAG: glycosyltransferase [Anaerolineales bacterium]